MTFVALPSAGLVLHPQEINGIIALYQNELDLNGWVMVDLEREDELGAYVSIDEPPRLFGGDRFLNLRCKLEFQRGPHGSF